jgi:hypothetical protein
LFSLIFLLFLFFLWVEYAAGLSKHKIPASYTVPIIYPEPGPELLTTLQAFPREKLIKVPVARCVRAPDLEI